MSRIIRMLVAATAAGGLTFFGLMMAGAASASTSGLSYEVDDGVSWTLATGPSSLSAPTQSATYADAGVVADIGPASQFAGITATGSANLADNIWIDDSTNSQPSEAITPGTHLLSDGVNFSYGFDNHNGTFTMQSGPYAGQTLSYADIQQDFAGHEAFAWVGVVYSGSTIKGFVTSINGQNTSHRNVGVALSGGTVTAYVK